MEDIMKKTFLLFILALCSIALFAQNLNWLWAKQAGGISGDKGYSIAVDAYGNSYITGYFRESATFGTTTLTSSSDYGSDIFVAKMDINGNWLWAKQAGGTDYDDGYSIAVDVNGNSYVTGYFYGSATFGTTTLTSSGSDDIFVAKLDINGNWLWAKQAGGTSYDYGNRIAVDAYGNSYVTGYFKSSSCSFGTITLNSSGYEDIFVAKMDSNGNWMWAKQAGGTSEDGGTSIAVDANGNSYVTGSFKESANFGTTTLTSSGSWDIFVAKIDHNGNWLWAKQAGGTDNNGGISIAVDANGNSYVTGGFYGSSCSFSTITLINSSIEYSDIFVAKIDYNGNWLWAKQAGGTSYDYGEGIAVDDNGNSYVTGRFGDSATFGTTTFTSSGDSDIFVAKLDSSGNWLWAKQAGGTDDDDGNGIAVDDNGNSYVTGYFWSSATFGATTLTSSSDYGSDIFVAKLGEVNSIDLPDIISFSGIRSIYPNPFNPLTTIDYEISMPADVKIEVYNNRGQLVRNFILGYKEQGSYKLTWEGEDNNGCLCSTGIYYIRMQAGKEIYIKKAVLLK